MLVALNDDACIVLLGFACFKRVFHFFKASSSNFIFVHKPPPPSSNGEKVCMCVRACVCLRARACVCVSVCLSVCFFVFSRQRYRVNDILKFCMSPPFSLSGGRFVPITAAPTHSIDTSRPQDSFELNGSGSPLRGTLIINQTTIITTVMTTTTSSRAISATTPLIFLNFSFSLSRLLATAVILACWRVCQCASRCKSQQKSQTLQLHQISVPQTLLWLFC